MNAFALGAELKQGIPVHFLPTVAYARQVVRWWIRDGVSASVASSSGQGGHWVEDNMLNLAASAHNLSS